MPASCNRKGAIIDRLVEMHGFDVTKVVSIGDSEMDLSMQVEGSRFIGFNPTRELKAAFWKQAFPLFMAKTSVVFANTSVWRSREGNRRGRVGAEVDHRQHARPRLKAQHPLVTRLILPRR